MKFWKLIPTVTVLVLSTSANAALIDRGNGMIYDTSQDITWLQDPRYAISSGYSTDGLMTKPEATTWVANLSFGGYDDWRLFSNNEILHLWNNDFLHGDLEIRFSNQNLFYDFSGFYWTSSAYCSGSFGDPSCTGSTVFSDGDLYNGSGYGDTAYVWAVADGDASVSAVPVPGALWLFGSGLISLVGFARHKKT